MALLLKLHHGTEQPNALVKFRYFNDLKALFVSEAQTRKSMHVPPPMLEYPKNARDLPEVVAAAIGDDYVDRDDSADIVGLTSISHTIPMRKSSALLRGFDQDAIEDAAKSIPRSSPVRHAPDTNSKRVKVEAAQAVDSKPVANASDSQPKGVTYTSIAQSVGRIYIHIFSVSCLKLSKLSLQMTSQASGPDFA